MTSTTHGYHIPGTPFVPSSTLPKKCGGPENCTICRDEVLVFGKSDTSSILTDCKRKAVSLVTEYIKNNWSSHTTAAGAKGYTVNLVWFSETITNWAAIVHATFAGGIYFEVSRNSAKCTTRIVAYTQAASMVIPDEEES